MTDIDKSFLGIGWSFPPTFSNTINSVEMVTDLEDIKQSLNILLSTALGERIKREDYGSDLGGFVFEPTSTSGLAIMKNTVEKTILVHEARIRLDDLTLESDLNDGVINIRIDFTVRTTNSRSNFVYPFYLKEGINI